MSDPPRGRLKQTPESYASLRAGRGPNALLAQAVELLAPSAGRALDIGAGPLNDALYLLEAGFAVDAVDADPHTAALAAQLDDPRLTVTRADLRGFAIVPATYALAVAIHVLPFLSRADLGRTVPAIVDGLAAGGVLCCTFLGSDDEWAGRRPRMTFLSRSEARGLLSGLEPVVFTEHRYQGVDAKDAPKHWHVLRCIFRKRR